MIRTKIWRDLYRFRGGVFFPMEKSQNFILIIKLLRDKMDDGTGRFSINSDLSLCNIFIYASGHVCIYFKIRNYV